MGQANGRPRLRSFCPFHRYGGKSLHHRRESRKSGISEAHGFQDSIAGKWSANRKLADYFRVPRKPPRADTSVNVARLLGTNPEFAFCGHVLGVPITSSGKPVDSICKDSEAGPCWSVPNQTLALLGGIQIVASRSLSG